MNTNLPHQSHISDGTHPIQNEGTQSNNTRSRRPCDACRRRKSRCEVVGGGPPCVLCRFHRQECTFLEHPQPRKRRAVSPSVDNDPTQEISARRVPAKDGSISVEQNTSQDQPVQDYANLRGPSLLKKTLGLQNHQHSRFIGATSQYERILLQLAQYNEKFEISVGLSAIRRVDQLDTAFVLSPDKGTRNYNDEVSDLDAIEKLVAPHGQALIHLYFRIVHPSFPVLHKKVFLEKYRRTHREFSPPLLAAVYILALNWWSYSTELALLPKPDVPMLERMAFKTMNDVIHRPKLSTIQAGLLLLQRPEGDSWALTTQLVGLAQDLGLHLDCSTWRIPSWERGLRKRLAWVIFMQDKWGALVHGRPSHISTVNWRVRPLHEDDFPENAADEDDEDGSTEVEKGRTLLCEMIKLTELLASMLSTFYTLEAEELQEQHASDGVRWVLEKAKPIQILLRQWYSNLPPSLSMENVAIRKLSSTGYLHLGYYAVEITLHRRIVRTLSPIDEPSLQSICRQAAQVRLKSAMDFVQNLRPEHLQSFWYSASKFCFAVIGTFTSLLWVTAPNQQEMDVFKSKLDEYRWTLRLSSKSADFLERAINMLETSTGVLVPAVNNSTNGGSPLNRYMTSTDYGPLSMSRLHFDSNMSEKSESEYHEDTSPECVAGETPGSIGATRTGWNVGKPWFGATGDLSGFGGVLGDHSGTMPISFTEVTELGEFHGGINFQ